MATIRSLTSQDSADLLKWRGGDEYKNAVITAELTEHFKGDRVIFVAVVGPAIVGTVQLAPCQADPDLGDGQVVANLQAWKYALSSGSRGLAGPW